MTVLRIFEFEHNRREAVRQEYELAREHYGEVRAHRQVFNPDHTKRFRDARQRLDRASELLRLAERGTGN